MTSISTAQADFASREKRAQYRWTGFILLFFVVQAILWTAAIVFTNSDASHVVVAGYDQRALNWDETQTARRASAALGWSASLNVDSSGDVDHEQVVTLSLCDNSGQAISGATVQLDAFHRGRAAVVQVLDFVEAAPGQYIASVQVQQPGNWQFSGFAGFEDKCFLIERTESLSSTGN